MRPWTLLILALPLGCGDKDGGDDSGQPQTNDSDETGDSPIDTEPEVETETATFSVLDANGVPLSDATVTMGDDTVTTGSDGLATFEVPHHSHFHARISANGYFPMNAYGYLDEEETRMTRGQFAEATVDFLLSALGLEDDTSKGVLYIFVRQQNQDGSFAALAGTTLSISASYESAIVHDTSADIGYSVGTTSLEGSTSNYYFLNVAPGAPGLSVTPPDGYSCFLYDSEDVTLDSTELQAIAGEFSTLTILCRNW